jgi:hypothetical protein
MNKTSYSLYFLPAEDRVALLLNSEGKNLPSLILTRRLVKMLCAYLKKLLENRVYSSSDIEVQSPSVKQEIAKFEHQAIVANADGVVNESSEPKKLRLENCFLATRIKFQTSEQSLSIIFLKGKRVMVNLGLGWEQVHYFLYAISKISKKAGWDLDSVLNWIDESSKAFISPVSSKYVC